MNQPTYTERDLAKAQYSARKRQRRQDRCNHKRRTFMLEEPVIGIPAVLVCDDCGHSLHGEAAKDARDSGLATTEYTGKALPSGQ
jgi:hypothetical protein